MTNTEAIKLLNTLYTTDVYINEALDHAIQAMNRPQGKWLTDERGYICSMCGALHIDEYPFCHMCGTDMRIKYELND